MSCKARLSDLAIFGGTPAFVEPAMSVGPISPVRTRFRRRLDQLLERRWLTNGGPLVREFEQRVAELLAVRHCVAMSSGTTAIEIAARATGLRGEVIVPSMTFVASVNALRWSGLTPVFCDIDPATRNLDPCRVEELIGPRTAAILGVHLWGRGCAVDALAEIAARHELTLIYDAAHAFACSHRGRLKRDHPEIAAAVARGEYKSMRQAALAGRDRQAAGRLQANRYDRSGLLD